MSTMQPPQYPVSSGQQWSNPAPPLDQPLYDAGFGQAIKRFFKKYATFSGRASRSEFWWMYLFGWLTEFAVIIVAVIGGLVTTDPDHPSTSGEGAMAGGFLLIAVILGMIVPAIALMVRRLHDIDFSAWWLLLLLGLSLGAIVLLIFALLPTNPRGARFDKDGGRQAMAGYYPPPPQQQYPGQGY
ncbi:DUF805 domain-containing protein [Spelaeicoccus albus]|uniref:Uncharacterized membrane protein YhaH (DUF805 family) n=1 Tax=Spelaeicoccus albus TaxID=1280376 RepID=A0A7Z0A9C9_9MICO|nr:DUF805 domain-containing protein [Spelaeicoccus albus]NYI66817.1 uncharacterized membrane protein YhaH (DUF805 family) [Spelaeicoccus albus]